MQHRKLTKSRTHLIISCLPRPTYSLSHHLRCDLNPIPPDPRPHASVARIFAVYLTEAVYACSWPIEFATKTNNLLPSTSRQPQPLNNKTTRNCKNVRRDRSYRAWLPPYVIPEALALSTSGPASTDRTDLGPFANEVTQILKIKNPNQTPVAFKVCFLWLDYLYL